MASKKNSKNKPSSKSKKIFDLIRNYCKEPWVSTDKELPKEMSLVLFAYYTGADSGYSHCIGWMKLIELPSDKESDDMDVSEVYMNSRSEAQARSIEIMMAPTVDVAADGEGGLSRRSKYEQGYYNLFNGYSSVTLKDLRTKYKVIKKDDKEYAVVWMMYSSATHETALFANSLAAGSVFKDPMSNSPQPDVNLHQPDFWMYIPEIK